MKSICVSVANSSGMIMHDNLLAIPAIDSGNFSLKAVLYCSVAECRFLDCTELIIKNFT